MRQKRSGRSCGCAATAAASNDDAASTAIATNTVSSSTANATAAAHVAAITTKRQQRHQAAAAAAATAAAAAPCHQRRLLRQLYRQPQRARKAPRACGEDRTERRRLDAHGARRDWRRRGQRAKLIGLVQQPGGGGAVFGGVRDDQGRWSALACAGRLGRRGRGRRGSRFHLSVFAFFFIKSEAPIVSRNGGDKAKLWPEIAQSTTRLDQHGERRCLLPSPRARPASHAADTSADRSPCAPFPPPLYAPAAVLPLRTGRPCRARQLRRQHRQARHRGHRGGPEQGASALAPPRCVACARALACWAPHWGAYEARRRWHSGWPTADRAAAPPPTWTATPPPATRGARADGAAADAARTALPPMPPPPSPPIHRP